VEGFWWGHGGREEPSASGGHWESRGKAQSWLRLGVKLQHWAFFTIFLIKIPHFYAHCN